MKRAVLPTTLILALLILAFRASASEGRAETTAPESTCIAAARAAQEERDRTNEGKFGKRKPGIASVLLEGTNPNRAILLLHGFIASPYEVLSLGRELHDQGHTVLMPVLSGFGGSTEGANDVRFEEWVADTRSAFLDLARCYPRVSLAGFSLGGSVAAALALEGDAEVRRALDSLVLISPAIRLKNRLVLDLFMPFSFLFGNRLEVERANRLPLRVGTRDLEIPAAHPETHNEDLPLRAARELRRLGRRIHFGDFETLRSVSITFVLNASDRTVNARVAARRAQRNHGAVAPIEVPASAGVRHQVLLPEENSRFEEILREVSAAVLRL